MKVSTIADWCQSGRLDGIQAVPNGPWWIKIDAGDHRRTAQTGPALLVPALRGLTDQDPKGRQALASQESSTPL